MADKPFFSPKDKELLKAQFAEASDMELEMFMRTCERTGLDPFLRQIYGRMQNEKVKGVNGAADTWKKKLITMTSIDGLRAISELSGKYRGQTKPEWYYADDDGKLGWHDVFIPKRDNKGHPISEPEACRVGVYKEGFLEPCYGVANFKSFAQYYESGGSWYLMKFWNDMPEHMIAKVAEAQAHKKAFPLISGSLFIEEEIRDENQQTPATPAPAAQFPAVAHKGENPAPATATAPVASATTTPAEPAKAKATPAPKPEPEKKPEPTPKAEPKPTPAPAAGGVGDEWKTYQLQVVKMATYKNRNLETFTLDELEALKVAWVEKNADKINGDPTREKERAMILAAFNAKTAAK